MKKLILIALFFITMNAWGQSAWIYDRQWAGITRYEGAGRAIFDDHADLHNNYSDGRLQRIEHPSNEQINLILYGLQQYTVRINDVYTILLVNNISKRRYAALVIITVTNSRGSPGFSYYFYEDLAYRRY